MNATSASREENIGFATATVRLAGPDVEGTGLVKAAVEITKPCIGYASLMEGMYDNRDTFG